MLVSCISQDPHIKYMFAESGAHNFWSKNIYTHSANTQTNTHAYFRTQARKWESNTMLSSGNDFGGYSFHVFIFDFSILLLETVSIATISSKDVIMMSFFQRINRVVSRTSGCARKCITWGGMGLGWLGLNARKMDSEKEREEGWDVVAGAQKIIAGESFHKTTYFKSFFFSWIPRKTILLFICLRVAFAIAIQLPL